MVRALTINHVVDIEDGLPVIAENVEAHVTLEVNVRVIYLQDVQFKKDLC